MKHYSRFISYFFSLVIFGSCSQSPEKAVLFELMDHKQTGLHFTNRLTPTAEINMFKYMYFYNGAGVGAADFNNDGLVDLFFASNQSDNKLFLNNGGLQFTDISSKAKIPQDGGWSTGVSVVDINNDGLLDIYVCRVGKFENLNSRNQLLVCDGIDESGTPIYADRAKEYGLDFSGFSTQSAFFDYDLDGDLDMFLMNHSLRYNNTFAPRNTYAGTYDSLSGDRLYRNEGKVFIDVTKEAGINSSIIGYGLGIAVSDINLDGYPDVYIGNDFHENDYLYINQRDGSFKEDLTNRIMHTSQFSMGVDIADVNNDAYPEIITLDMLPSDPYILRRSLGEDAYDVFTAKVRNGYNQQYARNALQYNRRSGMFSEIGLYAGVHATDWSWAPLWMDFDNDGLKDLFISNGIPKRLNDMDYVNFASDEEVKRKIATNSLDEKDLALIDAFPEIKIPNRFFHNSGNLSFKNANEQISNGRESFSNGAVYADFDNDGDLDIVVSNIDEPAFLYKNSSADKNQGNAAQIKLSGPQQNINAIGSKIIVYYKDEVRTYEKFAARGFQSSMEIPIHVGLNNIKPDSAVLIWPDNSCQQVSLSADSNFLSINYTGQLPKFNYESFEVESNQANQTNHSPTHWSDITYELNILYKHVENPFVEFDREPLIPHMLSTEGPALATGDFNGDNLDDVFIGSSKGKKSALFFQRADGRFYRTEQPAVDADSVYEDVDACVVDVNNDDQMDLLIASGGNEFYGKNEHMVPRLYLNDGGGKLIRNENAFTDLYITASCIEPYDFNNDGYTDLFLGARAVPFDYGEAAQSYFLQNDGKGTFVNVTEKIAGDVINGFVTSASWVDIDMDNDKDLILSLEWDGIHALINENGRFVKKALTDKKGFWKFSLPCDIDNDGDIDLIAGNLGLNSRLQASSKEPVKMYFDDFDGNGKREQLLTYFVSGKEIPFANKEELTKQIPVMKKKYLYAADFAKASLYEIFASNKLNEAMVYTVDYVENAVLINDGKGNFSIQSLPWEAQLSSYSAAAIINANNDALPDILLGGNFYANNVKMGRYDADFGTVLINKGNGQFSCESLNGLQIKGQVRKIEKIKVGTKDAYLVARNNDSTMIIAFSK